MARSERAKQLQQFLESTGRKLPAQRTGANRNAYIDFDVTGKANLGEEGGPLSPGNGLPLGGLIQGGEGYGLYGGLHSEQIKLGIKRMFSGRKSFFYDFWFISFNCIFNNFTNIDILFDKFKFTFT